jgi:hypothetical protein
VFVRLRGSGVSNGTPDKDSNSPAPARKTSVLRRHSGMSAVQRRAGAAAKAAKKYADYEVCIYLIGLQTSFFVWHRCVDHCCDMAILEGIM